MTAKNVHLHILLDDMAKVEPGSAFMLNSLSFFLGATALRSLPEHCLIRDVRG